MDGCSKRLNRMLNAPCEFCNMEHCSEHHNPLFHGCEHKARAKARAKNKMPPPKRYQTEPRRKQVREAMKSKLSAKV